MIRWIKHYIWFIKESRSFLRTNTWGVIRQGGLKRGIMYSNEMCKWDKATPKQREDWYLSGEGRLIEFDE